MVENLDMDMVIKAMTKDQLFSLMRKIEHLHDVRIGVVTKEDVNDIFGMALASEGIESRELTDEEWEKFTHTWFWVKGHPEIMWEGIQEAVTFDMKWDGLLPETVIAY